MRGKRILVGISGGIAAYKIAFLIRLLKKSGAEVKCIMTPASCDFISPLVVSTLSENPVGIEFWNKQTGEWNNHVDYGLWADIMLVAPLTANTLSKMASGACDNLLLASFLSLKCPAVVAPAMDLDMYQHPTTKRNLAQLENDGLIIIPAEKGELASGLVGEGRMAEPETIHKFLQDYFTEKGRLKGKKVLMTAGPTYEAIDPVRFIGNHSSGKMGFAIAEELADEGAEVILISGPSKENLKDASITRVNVSSAEEMLAEVQKHWENSDLGVFAAAVADYRPKEIAKEKIKKSDDTISLELIKNPDILKWAGSVKNGNQFLVGFALETENMLENAKKKLALKNLDLIVMNNSKEEGAGFSVDTNKISILDADNNVAVFELKTKLEAAKDIVNSIVEKLK
jgi:phosphopantothenoylcysteine decarboxylase/phosphopantothenate--cysteine ligase